MNAAAVILAFLLIQAATVLGGDQTNIAPARPLSWARPVVIPGVSNCFQIDSNLFRGSQPSAEGVAQLKARGIKTIINLRTFHSDKALLKTGDPAGQHIKTQPWHVEAKDVSRFLQIVTDTNNLPAYVHCQRGADRTGLMCAMYRVVVCDWSKAEALAEMKQGGYGFAPVWQNLVRELEAADVQGLRRKIGLRPAAKGQ